MLTEMHFSCRTEHVPTVHLFLATNVLSKTISLSSISNWGSRSDTNHAHAPEVERIVHLEFVIHRHGRVLELSFFNDL